MKLSWVTLHVSDMDKSVAFYRDLLGLKIDRQFGNEEHMIDRKSTRLNSSH